MIDSIFFVRLHILIINDIIKIFGVKRQQNKTMLSKIAKTLAINKMSATLQHDYRNVKLLTIFLKNI